ncbi:unnamed protein product [Macrosiphum euphorbiae]|uniref:Zinc finger MYM-type protein 1-like n=1 Tax=Macrosiphum euphorbiae TaxID=13131 RepID=A0AAV0Y3K2_9HEMI|nr:unnamed protein product [Macrosiphum euphorbiae]CAI6361361.1 unnamed protein product [Macrosiphum euphorbiae]CAI6362015.1 unnamed protein product [Macrosiphum euphorbiae]CAI6375494.1 unnamed protein product [Macrosiphum euphorbiae]CAI6376216.1 unnamed protein product [Macrosiphum euphorbiae]
MSKPMSGAQKRKKKIEQKLKDAKLPKLDSFLKNTVESTSENPTITTSVFEIPHENSEKNNVIDICQNMNNTDDCDILLSKNMTIICTKQYPTDIANYIQNSVLRHLSVEDKQFIVEHGPCRPSGPFSRNAVGRCFDESFYYTVSKAGLRISRSWLCYSPELHKCYCQPCWLFGDNNIKHQEWIRGFNDWAHTSRGIERHEKSIPHKMACMAFYSFQNHNTVNENQEKQIRDEANYWKLVLDRIIATTLTLATEDIPFRGHRENNETESKGKFLAIIELLGKYDPVLTELLQRPKGTIKYLSPAIQNEIITALGDKVKYDILLEIRKAPFFSYISDSTQDISKIDQQSHIFRYVNVMYDKENKPVDIVIHESFIGFEIMEGQTSSEMEQQLYNNFEKNKIDIKKLRGIGFDGAANMSGVYSGLQARIKHTQPLALYVHCAAHNLNLVINDSVKNITEIQNFYEKLECLYSYFANSIKRWAHLKSVSSVSVSLKRLCTTRWSSRNDCLKALSLLYVDILKLLAYISLMGRNKDEKSKASGLQNYFQKFDVILIIVIESKILNSLQIVSLLLQKSDIDLLKAFELLQTALNKIKEMRNKFEEVFEEAKQIAISWGVEPTFTKIRKTKTTKFFDELSNDERLHDAEQYFKTQIYYRTLDIIIKQLEHRFNGMNQVIKLFSSILPINICSMNENELKHLTTSLVNNYEHDLTIDLVNQIIQFKRSFENQISKLNSVHDLAKFIIVDNYLIAASFPDLCTACFLFLTIPVTVATAERSFSKLKIIKNYLRSTMSQIRLSSLAIISIEKKIAKEINTSDIISTLANKKSRRMF